MNQAPAKLNGTARELGEDDEKPEVSGESDAEILKRIQSRVELAGEAWSEYRAKAVKDVSFCDLDQQWPEVEKSKRESEGRPVLVEDRTNPFVDQLVNHERQNRPAMTVHPVSDGANQKTAEILKGYLRHVEIWSNADFAYDRASEAQKRGGFGFWRVMTDYIDEKSFDQDIKIVSIPNPFMWFIDPKSTEPDGSDMDWAFGQEDMTQEEFKHQFPRADMSASDMSPASWMRIGDEAPEWIGKDGKSARVVEYYEKVRKRVKIYLLDDGSVVNSLPKGAKSKKERESYKTIIMWYKACANEILDRREVPGKFIPVVPVYGKELILNGKRDYWGVVRPMKGVQQMINVFKCSLTESIGLAPKAPWLMPMEGMPDGQKEVWDKANTNNYSTLYYNAWADGKQLPAPQRNVQEPAIQAITLALKSNEDALKAVTGMYDPSLGDRGGGDQSGVAIGKLQNQGMVGNFHLTDNMNRAIRHTARIVLGMVPDVIDTERMLRIVGADGKASQVVVNSQDPQKDPKTGEPVIYDFTTGYYDVVVDAGPSYLTQRQENLTNIINAAHVFPAIAQMGADVAVRNMDFPEADELADRITPPQFKNKDGQPPIPPEIQHQLQGLSQMNDALTKRVHQLMDALESKQAELASKEKVAVINAEASLGVAEIKANQAAMSIEIDHIHKLYDVMLAQTGMAQDAALKLRDQNLSQQEPAGQPAGDSTPAAPAAPSNATVPDAVEGDSLS